MTLSLHKTQEGRTPNQSSGAFLETLETDLGEHNFRRKIHTMQPVSSVFPGCRLPSSQFWVTSSLEGISKLLNSLCLYLYPNDRTLRCKLNRNLVSKSCYFLRDTSIKAGEALHCCQTPRTDFKGPPVSLGHTRRQKFSLSNHRVRVFFFFFSFQWMNLLIFSFPSSGDGASVWVPKGTEVLWPWFISWQRGT